MEGHKYVSHIYVSIWLCMSYEAGVTEDGNGVLHYVYEVVNPDSDYEDPTIDRMNVDDYNGGEVAGNRDTSDNVEEPDNPDDEDYVDGDYDGVANNRDTSENVEENPSEECDENPYCGTGDSTIIDDFNKKRKLRSRLLDKLEALIETFPS